MPPLKTIPSSIDQGVDRKTLNIIKQRFLQVNAERLARTKSALGGRQQIFLDVLPMLFHVNHPILPGYVSHQTPAGLDDYNPSKAEVRSVQRLSRSFAYRPAPTILRQISALFLMGSSGTVAQSEKSDLDIWVCHQRSLGRENLQQLRKKCDDITQWALSIGLEAHFFLMEEQKFRSGESGSLSAEDCGSTQHYLLLDEFYRTSLLVAGRLPMWWLIPPSEDHNYDYYADTLRKKRFVRAGTTIDFGGIDNIPAGEFIGAGVWQLYKAIDSPYKSVLKILLTEVYAAEYPNVEPLSTTFKRAIYNKKLDINELDPYVVVYRKLENYLLSRNELERLELVRRCFYFKVGKALTRSSRASGKSWQRQLLEKLTNEWGWQRQHLYSLDARNQWKVGRVISEQKELVRELTNSYRFVLDFARKTRATAMINSQEMTILGRKLYAAFERKAGKIEWINPGIAPNLVEEHLTFFQLNNPQNGEPQWVVSNEAANNREPTSNAILKRADELSTLLAWCHFNNLLDTSTRLAIIEGEHNVTDIELSKTARSLQQYLPIAKQYSEEGEEKHEQFNQAMHPTHILLLVNVGVDPLAHIRSKGIERLSAQTDSLGYSGLRENLVLNLEQIVVNSWGELSSKRYEGANALLHCLCDYLKMILPANKNPLPTLEIQCFCPTRASAIASRLNELFNDIRKCYYSGKNALNNRYIIEIQRQFYVLQFNDQQPHFEHADQQIDLLKLLGSPQEKYSKIVLDRYCMQKTTLQAIVPFAQADKIQVFYQQRNSMPAKKADIYVLDERNSLFSFSTPIYTIKTLLTPLDQFIQSILFRQSSETVNQPETAVNDFDFLNRDIEYFEISDKKGSKQVSQHPIIAEFESNHFFNVQAIGHRNITGEIVFDIFCDQKEFFVNEVGNELFTDVAKYILSKRNSSERYPCYITDLDLSRCIDDTVDQSIQTIQYLRHKHQLELQINRALERL